jgi:PAS domain S-box-containing protein
MQWILRGRYYDVVGTPVLDEAGNISRIVLVYMDITERIFAGEALRRSEEKYRDLFENANDLIQSIGPDGSVLYVNTAWRETLGYSREEIENLSIFDVVHPECAENCSADFRSVVYGEKDGRIETMFVTKSGGKIAVEGNVNTILEEGKFCGTRGIFRDMTERKEAEEALASEKERLAVTLKSIGDGVITTNMEGRVVLINKVAEVLTGWSQEEAHGRPVTEVFHIIDEKTRERSENPIGNVLHSGEPFELSDQITLVSKDGSERLISNSGAPIRDSKSTVIGAVLVFRDVAEKRKMEEELLKTEKLESLGVLAGGLAHDFNNMLNAIIGNIDLALTHVDAEDELRKRLMQAEKASFRAKDLTNQLLTFSRGGAPIKKAASIADLIKDSAGFAIRGSHIKCEFSLPEDLWAVEIDEGQISQVINNLVINAVQAMPAGGVISIRAENFLAGLPKSQQAKEKRFVKISIEDNGVGIPRQHLNRIFEPYYTTKDTGTGLGLATTYSIVRSHGGLIDVDSAAGKGTTFSILLPALPGAFRFHPVAGQSLAETKAKGRVLLMDDDELVRSTAAAMLKRIGYNAEFAEDGSEALLKYEEAKTSNTPFHALIVDLTVPGGMGGKETIKKLLEIDPSARAIVSSGYSNDPIMANYRHYGFVGVLAKPYKLNDLRETLRNIIETDL